MIFTDAQGYPAMGNRFTIETFPGGEKPAVSDRISRVCVRLEAPKFVFLFISTLFVMKHPRKGEQPLGASHSGPASVGQLFMALTGAGPGRGSLGSAYGWSHISLTFRLSISYFSGNTFFLATLRGAANGFKSFSYI